MEKLKPNADMISNNPQAKKKYSSNSHHKKSSCSFNVLFSERPYAGAIYAEPNSKNVESLKKSIEDNKEELESTKKDLIEQTREIISKIEAKHSKSLKKIDSLGILEKAKYDLTDINKLKTTIMSFATQKDNQLSLLFRKWHRIDCNALNPRLNTLENCMNETQNIIKAVELTVIENVLPNIKVKQLCFSKYYQIRN